MQRINGDLDLDSLRIELRKKDNDLLLAARCGESLLEENDQLKSQLKLLRDEYSNLQESLESQKHEYQRNIALVKGTAEMNISELEQQLKNTNQALEHEKALAHSSKEEHRKCVEGLQIENAQLQAELQQALLEKQKEVEIQLELKKRVEECEREKSEMSKNVLEMQKEIQHLQESNRTITLDVSTLVHTCDKLSDELHASQEDLDFWEKQYAAKSGELSSQSKELEDSQELVKQLQLQLDQQNIMLLTPNSATSLFEELTSPNFPMIPEEVCSNFSDVSSSQDSLDLPELPDDSATLQRNHTWPKTEEYNCTRCQESKKQLHKQEEELKCVTEQLLIAVQQKFKLQQQIEAWQTDMTLIVEQHIQKQLKRDCQEAINRKNAMDKTSNTDICAPSHEFMLHLLRNTSVI